MSFWVLNLLVRKVNHWASNNWRTPVRPICSIYYLWGGGKSTNAMGIKTAVAWRLPLTIRMVPITNTGCSVWYATFTLNTFVCCSSGYVCWRLFIWDCGGDRAWFFLTAHKGHFVGRRDVDECGTHREGWGRCWPKSASKGSDFFTLPSSS
jgi:hypothetical protein